MAAGAPTVTSIFQTAGRSKSRRAGVCLPTTLAPLKQAAKVPHGLPFTFYVDTYMGTLPLQTELWFFHQGKGNKFLVSANSLGSHFFSQPGNATCPVFQ